MIRRFRRIGEKILYRAYRIIPVIGLTPNMLSSAVQGQSVIGLGASLMGSATQGQAVIDLSYTFEVA